MVTLDQFIAKENQWRSIFNQAPLSTATAEDRKHLAGVIEGKLSPENLTCDGELPMATVRKNHAILIKCAQELVRIDPSIKFYELA